jgi:hypothetical protein
MLFIFLTCQSNFTVRTIVNLLFNFYPEQLQGSFDTALKTTA